MFRPSPAPAPRIRTGSDGNPTDFVAYVDNETGAQVLWSQIAPRAAPPVDAPPYRAPHGWGGHLLRGLGDVAEAPPGAFVLLGIAAGAFFAPKEKAFAGAALGGLLGSFLQGAV